MAEKAEGEVFFDSLYAIQHKKIKERQPSQKGVLMDTTEAEKKSMESMETDSPRKEGVKKRPIPPADGRQNTEESFVTPQKLLEQGWIAETRGFQAANARILTARRMVALADFSAGDPLRWRTIRARFFFEELGVNDLAKMLGISRRTVSRHLQPVHISEDVYDELPLFRRALPLPNPSSAAASE